MASATATATAVDAARVAAGAPLAVTVLGSGGPRPHHGRASASYLLWADGEPVGLVDAGGGALDRLADVGVRADRLQVVLLTHTHIDHTGGLAPVVFAAWMEGRTRPLAVVGPTGRDEHPGCGRFCDLLFGPAGAWSYLHRFDGFALATAEVAHDAAHPAAAWAAGSLSVRGVGVPHGMMPAVAYRVDHAGCSVTFSGDVARAHGPLVALAQGSDVLVHDQALPARDLPHGHLHPPPADTAADAQRAGVRTLVLSHLMAPADDARSDVETAVARGFDGRVLWAADRCTVAVRPDGTVVTDLPTAAG